MHIPDSPLRSAVYQTNPLRGREHDRTARLKAVDFQAMVSSGGLTVHNDGAFEVTRHNKSRLGKKRTLRGGSHDLHLHPLELWAQREISRDLKRNSQLISGAIEQLDINVIHCGFALGMPKRSMREARTAAEKQREQWKRWQKFCHAGKRLHHWDLQGLSEQTEITDGDCFLYLNPDGNNGYGSVHLLEGDRVLTPIGVEDNDATRVWNGIRFDVFTGAPVEVFVARCAPSFNHIREEEGQWYPVFDPWDPGAGGIVISGLPTRESSSRGEPWCAAAVREHDDIDAVLVAVRIALRQCANKSSYTKTEDIASYLELLKSQGYEPDELQPPLESIEPGEHYLLNPGEEIGVVDWSGLPGSNFKDFILTELRMLGLGRIQLPIEMLLLDWSARSFSAQRLALDTARHNFKRRQKRVERYRVDPVWMFFVARMQAKGEIDRSDLAFEARWRAPRWPYIEPVKDIKAQALAHKLKVKSRRTIAEEGGYEYDAEREEIEDEEPDSQSEASGTEGDDSNE